MTKMTIYGQTRSSPHLHILRGVRQPISVRRRDLHAQWPRTKQHEAVREAKQYGVEDDAFIDSSEGKQSVLIKYQVAKLSIRRKRQVRLWTTVLCLVLV